MPRNILTEVTCLFVVLYVTLPGHLALDYFCYPNGTLMVIYPKGDFTAVRVKDESDVCKTSSIENNLLRIDHCKMDHFVHVIFFKDSQPPIIITRNSFKAYIIMCKSIPTEGIEISVSVGMGTRNHIEEMEQKPETSQLSRIFSHVGDKNSKQFEKLPLNAKFEWVFEIADGYHTLPESCTAYAGRVPSPDVQSKTLITNGCTQYGDVISNYIRIPTDDSDKNRYSLQFNVFRFEDNPFITVVCSMRVCPGNSHQNCVPTCDKKRRRKRRRRSLDDLDLIAEAIDSLNDMSVVLEVVDERPLADTGSSSKKMDDIWATMMEDLNSGSTGSSMSILSLFLLFVCLASSSG